MGKVIAFLDLSLGHLDNDYTLFDTGIVVHAYDKSIYPGGQHLREEWDAKEVAEEIKVQLLNAADEDDKELAKQLLGLSDSGNYLYIVKI